jgi:predicted nucleotidyltransferase
MPASPSTPALAPVRHVLRQTPQLQFAVLVGSRATGKAHAQSDWDIALQWQPGMDWMDQLGATETLRRQLAQALYASTERVDCIDLIDLHRANLTMRASVAEEGIPLLGDETLEWARFLTRTWRDLEDFDWSQKHAA